MLHILDIDNCVDITCMGKNCVYKGQKMILLYIRELLYFASKITKNSYISCKNNPIFLLYFGKDLVDSLQLNSLHKVTQQKIVL